MAEAHEPVPYERRTSSRPTLREIMTDVFALLIVGVWALAIGSQLLSPSDASLQYAERINALLGPLLGVVVGLYLGANAGERAMRQAERRAEQASEAKEAVKALSQEELDAARRRYEELTERLRRLQSAHVDD